MKVSWTMPTLNLLCFFFVTICTARGWLFSTRIFYYLTCECFCNKNNFLYINWPECQSEWKKCCLLFYYRLKRDYHLMLSNMAVLTPVMINIPGYTKRLHRNPDPKVDWYHNQTLNRVRVDCGLKTERKLSLNKWSELFLSLNHTSFRLMFKHLGTRNKQKKFTRGCFMELGRKISRVEESCCVNWNADVYFEQQISALLLVFHQTRRNLSRIHGRWKTRNIDPKLATKQYFATSWLFSRSGCL